MMLKLKKDFFAQRGAPANFSLGEKVL